MVGVCGKWFAIKCVLGVSLIEDLEQGGRKRTFRRFLQRSPVYGRNENDGVEC